MTFALIPGPEGRQALETMMRQINVMAELNGLFATDEAKEWIDKFPVYEAMGVEPARKDLIKVEEEESDTNKVIYTPAQSIISAADYLNIVSPPLTDPTSPTTMEKRKLAAQYSSSSTSTYSSSQRSMASSYSSSSSERSIFSQPSRSAAKRHPPVVLPHRSRSMVHPRDRPHQMSRNEKSPFRSRRPLVQHRDHPSPDFPRRRNPKRVRTTTMAQAFRQLRDGPIMKKVKDRWTGRFILRQRTPSPPHLSPVRREDRVAAESTPVPGGKKVAELPTHWQADVTMSPSKGNTTVEKVTFSSILPE